MNIYSFIDKLYDIPDSFMSQIIAGKKIHEVVESTEFKLNEIILEQKQLLQASQKNTTMFK